MSRFGPMLGVAAVTVCMAAPAIGQEYCVACTGPNVFYRCVIDGAKPGNATALPLLCISTLAKEGAHATCAVRRDVGVIDCNGPVKHVSVPDEGAPKPLDQATPVPPDAAKKAAAPKGDPKTVEEMLQRAKANNDRAWEKTNAQIQSNNEKIGGFFKKSWDCVSSLFSRCGEKQN